MGNRLTKKLLATLLAVCMIVALMPVSVFAAERTVSNETELKQALENADCAEIKLGGNVETTWELNVARTVTLDLNGYTLSCSSTDEDIIRVRSSGNLTVKDSGTGGKIDGQNKNCGFNVKGGTLTLESGSIVNCTDANGDGGAVDVENTGVTETPTKYGKFVMNGGAIMDCKASDDGGAVDIGSGCEFIMNGGTIDSCRADDDGGAVFIKRSGTFKLNGGIIQNCSAGANGGAVNICEDGCFTMTGGAIKSCRVDLGGLGMAVYGSNDKAVVTMTGGTFEDCGAYPYSFDEFTVTFDSDGGSAVSEQKLRNAPAVEPDAPKKKGYVFDGWYLGNTQYSFDTNVTNNITLKAHWKPGIIDNVNINDVATSYTHGEKPKATAAVAADSTEKYKIVTECWEKLEKNEAGILVPVAYWYSNERCYQDGTAKFTEFEKDIQYRYSIKLEAIGDFKVDVNTGLTINGKEITLETGAVNVTADKAICFSNVMTITPKAFSGGGYYVPVQKPEIITGEGGKATLENNGTTLVVAPDDGMQISKVTVNGNEVTVTDNKITGLKTGDKVEVTFDKIPPAKEEIDKAFKEKLLNLGLTVRTSKTTKKNVKAVVKETSELKDLIKEIKDAGYTVKYKFYRSTKKSSKYIATVTKTENTYTNTTGKKGTKYYYKARLAVYDTDGNLVAQTELKQCKYGLRTWSK